MIIEYNLSDIESVAKKLIEFCDSRTLLFYGEMGSGKTTLIKRLVKELGVSEVANSPTYGFVNIYETDKGEQINHFDLYRLQSEEEAYDIGLEEYFYGDDWNFIEWPEVALNIIPENFIKLTFEKVNENVRKLTIQKN